MIVIVKTVKGTVELFETQSYVVSTMKDMHPDILDLKIYADRKLLLHKKRRCQWLYKKFLYKPVQQVLHSEEQQENPAAESQGK